ncbi:hypothetical protein AAD001_09725 [Colwelliaceae bacterium 6471]
MSISKEKSNFTDKKVKSKSKWDGIERRHGHDVWFYLARLLSVSGWFIFTVALVLSYYAAPPQEYGLLRYYNIEVRQFWRTPLTGYLYILLWASAAISYIYIIMARYRRRRKTDHKHYDVFMLLMVSIAWVVYILMQLR